MSISRGMKKNGCKWAAAARERVRSRLGKKEQKMAEFRIPDAYELIREEALDDIRAEGLLLRHRKSGARVVLIPCRDTNKVFNIGFRTPPGDSTGVAHIIEHTVLCGSRAFPLKDPFVELVKGSLNTFLNAMTFPDKTIYPVASTNDADFRNLMHVYLDAVFYPNIYRERNIFRQEGWHYEIESPEGELTLNGVVYNEMKGAFSTPESVLERQTMNALFPDTPYGVESGGDPRFIPELTYENYLACHRRWYHPSNSYLFLYGDMDMTDTLTFIDGQYLSAFDAAPCGDTAIPVQKPFPEPVTRTDSYPVSEEEPLTENTYLSFNVVTGNALDMKELVVCEVLDYALLSAPGAPVRQALLDAGIGKDVYGEFNDGILQPYFSVVAKNADAEQAGEFTEVIRRVLTEQAEKGIDRRSLEAGINSLEFQFREADFASYPKGLMYALSVMDTWLYDDERPFDALKKLDIFRELREEIGTGLFERFVREKLLDNHHAVLMILKPERGLAERAERETAERLAAKKASMTEEEIGTLIRDGEALTKWQEMPESEENIAALPVLKRSDISRESVRLSNEEGFLPVPDGNGGERRIRTIYHSAESNGIGYLELLFDAGDLSEDELSFLSLLKSVLQNVDTAGRSYMELNNEINAETGGISFGLSAYDDHDDPEGYTVYLGVRMKALYTKLKDGMTLIREIMTESRFDDAKRIREIIAQTRSSLQMFLQQSGNAAAAVRALAYVSPSGAFSDLISGIAYYRFIRDLEEHYEERKEEIRSRLESLAEKIFAGNRLLISYTSDADGREALREAAGICYVAPGEAVTGERVQVKPLGKLLEGFTTPGQVQFVAMAGNFVKDGYAYHGAMNCLRPILSYGYLWQNVRVKGGAYGCSASFRRNGSSILASYRDPNLAATRDVYLGIPDYLEAFRADEKEMTKYVIGTISAMDTPLTPSMLGSVSLRFYLQGVTQEELDRTRREILEATDADIRALAPAVRAALDEGNLCVIGGTGKISESKELFGRVENLL